MKLLRRLLVSVGSMLLGYYLITEAFAIHPFLGGIVLSIAICTLLYMIRNNTKQQLMEQEMWLARDKDKTLVLFPCEKPVKDKLHWCAERWIILDEDLFPEVQWSDDEPTKVKLVIDK